MTTSVSRRLNILCIMFKFIVFFTITLFTRLYVSVGIILRREKTLSHHFTKRVRGWAHDNYFSTSHFIEVHVVSQESER